MPAPTPTRDDARRAAARAAGEREAARLADLATWTEAQHESVAHAAGLRQDVGGWWTTPDRRWRLHLGRVLGHGAGSDRWEWMVYDSLGQVGRGYPVRCDELSTALRYAVESLARERATTRRPAAA